MKHVQRSTLPARAARPQPRHRLEKPARTQPEPRRRSAVVGTVAGIALASSLVSVAAPASATSSDDRPDRGDRRERTFVARSDDSIGSSMSKQDLPDDSDGPLGSRIVAIAASKAGTPYAYGATGPGSFDCSGFTQWVYNRIGRDLPRTSSAQAGAVRRISAGDARPGDLVFFTGGGGVYHVGIYAGGGAIWHAPRPGEGVQREQIWTSSVFYGRP